MAGERALGVNSMRKWAIRLVTYPVLVVLTLIFVGPTLPLDISILIISSIVAAIGLTKAGNTLSIRIYLAAWRSRILSALRG
jgi:hypothetical protein